MVDKATLRKRFLRNLRLAGLNREDEILAVTLPNLQSKVALELLLSVEEEFPVVIRHLHVGAELPGEIGLLARKTVGSETFAERAPSTYTELKVLVARLAKPGQVVVLPMVAEEVAAYFLEEVLRGNLAGLSLEASNRTAYPLATTTLEEIRRVAGPSSLRPQCIASSNLLSILEKSVDPRAAAKFYVENYARPR
ncbi:hypothetical protein [Thermofilum pendens]|uniref:Uncharacterized protein n=1 Tax=Thermofilum pendens (strain DSM 2475 / Hrk 5) TaxID=368408 RepID=A1RX81_THEPD|nr:hypothetical protein [Thermofilum pendens]ABL77811.1 hypothetical protein Tpen_0402 [Thermofilum pendens Hrk 5]